jgi:crotonobetainyl-CoA:carnitine CoA-transferase CaiB-like acyl-CoA transferase
VHHDPQVAANAYLQTLVTGGGDTVTLPANPVQFDETPPSTRAAPAHGEHGDAILQEIGIGMDEILEHKMAGVLL